MTSLSKSFTLEEVEALLAAERERCAALCFAFYEERWLKMQDQPNQSLRNWYHGNAAGAMKLADQIRKLPPNRRPHDARSE